jgi:hypothetical protein
MAIASSQSRHHDNGYEDGDSTDNYTYVNKPFLLRKSLYKTFKKSFLVKIHVILWLKVLPIKNSYFLFRKKLKIILLIFTFIKNMLFFRGKIKRSVSDEEATTERRDMDKICPCEAVCSSFPKA